MTTIKTVAFFTTLLALFGISDITAETRHAAYTQEVKDAFSQLTIELEKHDEEREHQDILDPNHTDKTEAWKRAIEIMKTLIVTLHERPPGYTDTMFWETGAKAVINTSLHDVPDFDESWKTVEKEGVTIFSNWAQTTVETWLDIPASKVDLRMILYVHQTAYACDILKKVAHIVKVYNRTSLAKSMTSADLLEALRTELKRHSDEEVRAFVTDPFIKTVISTLKSIEKTNQWPE